METEAVQSGRISATSTSGYDFGVIAGDRTAWEQLYSWYRIKRWNFGKFIQKVRGTYK